MASSSAFLLRTPTTTPGDADDRPGPAGGPGSDPEGAEGPEDESQGEEGRGFDLRAAYESFAAETSAHGFRWTVRGGHSRAGAVLWPVLVAAATAAAGFSVVTVTRDYGDGPQFSSEYSLVSSEAGGGDPAAAEGVEMPDIIVCDPNPWDQKKIEALNISYQMVSYLTYSLSPFTSNLRLFSERRKGKLDRLEDAYHALVRDRFGGDALSLLRAVTVSCRDFVVLCKLGLAPPAAGDRCCGDLFHPDGVFTFDGKCFSTQGGDSDPHRVYYPAKPLGVSVTVRASPDLSPRLDRRVADWLPASRRGAAFAVSDGPTHPTVSLMQGGRGARPGTVTDVPVSKETVDFTRTLGGAGGWVGRLLGGGKETCVDADRDPGRGLGLVPGFGRYTRENCKLGKVQRGANHFYGCNIVAIPPASKSLPYCSPLQSVKFYEGYGRYNTAGGREVYNLRAKVVQPEEAVKGGNFSYKFSSGNSSSYPLSHYDRLFAAGLEEDNYSTFRCPRDCRHARFRTSTSALDLSGEGLRLISWQDAAARAVSSDPAGLGHLSPVADYDDLRTVLLGTAWGGGGDDEGNDGSILEDVVKALKNGGSRKKKNTKKKVAEEGPPPGEYAMLEFYYPSFDFLRVTQHRRGPLEWLADIGGSLGLYLGASVFTVFELLWFAWRVASDGLLLGLRTKKERQS